VSLVGDRTARIASVGFEYPAREQEPVPTCNLCGSSDHVELAQRDRYGFPAPLRMCVQCGLAFLSPRLTPDEYSVFYRDVYRPLVSAYHGRRIDAVTLPAEQREYALELVRFLRGALARTPASLLDIGGSTGAVAAAVADAFRAHATVLDPAPDELAVAAAAGLETVEGFAEEFDAGGRTWDLVLLCQTIDHLLDVGATLESMRRLVADDGRVFVDALDFVRVAERSASLEAAVKVDHPYSFTRETAEAFFVRTGFEVVAERLSADDHWGFVLAPTDPREPDWARLRAVAAERLDALRALS
jgi:SAM-dependent methyltransferase